MANKVYPKWRAQRMRSGTDATHALNSAEGTTGVFACLVDTGVYTYADAHEFYSSLTGIVGTDQEILTKTITDGVNGGNFNGANLVFPTVSGATAEAIVIYRKNAGANTTWPLISYQDTGVTGLPVTPNTGNININWNSNPIISL